MAEELDQAIAVPEQDDSNEALIRHAGGLHIHNYPAGFVGPHQDTMADAIQTKPEIPAPKPQAAPEAPAIESKPPTTSQGIQVPQQAPTLAGVTPANGQEKAQKKLGLIDQQKQAIDAMPEGVQKDQARLSLEKFQGSGVDRLMTHAQAIKNPFLRKLAEFGAGAAKVGSVAEGILAPGLAEATPGTDVRHMFNEGMDNQAIKADLSNAKEQADTKETNARADALAHPKETPIGDPFADGRGGWNQVMNGPNGPHIVPVASAKAEPQGIQLPAAPKVNAAAPTMGGGGIMVPPVAAPAQTGMPAAGTKLGAAPEKKTEEEKFMDQYMRDHGLTGTSADQQAAHAAWQQTPKQPAIGDAKAKTYQGELPDKLGDYDPAKFPITADMTGAEAEKQLSDARAAHSSAGHDKSAVDAAARAAAKPPQGGMYSATVNGREVAGTSSQLKKLGIKEEDMLKVGQENESKIENARVLDQWLTSTDKDDPGIISIAHKLDKEGKLGPIMSRYQDFINKTGSVLGFDSGDPDFQKLMTGMGLETTALMQVHVGSRGGAALLDHFHDLADAKAMSGKAFLAALDYESKYIKRKALYANAPSGGGNSKEDMAWNPKSGKYEPKPKGE